MAPLEDITVQSDVDSESFNFEKSVDYVPTDFPVTIAVNTSRIAPGLIDTVASNLRIVLVALGVPASKVIYYRIRFVGDSHLFIAVDENDAVVYVSPSRLAMITSIVDLSRLKEYTGSMTYDPLGALLLKPGGNDGERISRYPPIFGYKATKGEKQIYDRNPELDVLRRDGYFALTFLPVPGVDRRLELTGEIASLWGYTISAHDTKWPDLLVLRNTNHTHEDLGGVPDEIWLQHAISRVMEDHLPIVEVDGIWMGSLPRKDKLSIAQSRARVFYAILDWFRNRKLPYVTARTFHCYVRRDLSAIVALGSLRDRSELTEWLSSYPYYNLGVAQVKTEMEASIAVYSGRDSRDIAIKDSSTDSWLVVRGPQASPKSLLMKKEELDKILRDYYSQPEVCSGKGSPLNSSDISKLSLDQLLKVVRISECEAASKGICLLPGYSPHGDWTVSHRARRAAIRTHSLRTHDSIGVYRLGPYTSPFFAYEVHQYVKIPEDARYRPVVHELNLAPDIGAGEDRLLKDILGTVCLLSVKEPATSTRGEREYTIMSVSSDRDGEVVRKVLFDAWRSGYLIGTWCRVMLEHRDELSVSVAGGTVDPLLSHAGDSIVDGNRWLDVASEAIKACSS